MGLLEIGRVVRPHGLRGEVVVALVTNRPGRLGAGATLFVGERPLTIESSRPHLGRHLVQFRGISSREAADELRDLEVSAEADLQEEATDGDALWVHELIGSSVVDTEGRTLGEVVSVEANPASDLLVLDSGGLVPCRFVESHSEGTVVVDIPEGLLE